MLEDNLRTSFAKLIWSYATIDNRDFHIGTNFQIEVCFIASALRTSSILELGAPAFRVICC